MRKGFDLMEMSYLLVQTNDNGTIITENIFATQNEPPTAKLSISGVLKHFCRKWKKHYIKGLKIDYFRKKISQRVWKGANLEEKFWFDGNDFFVQTNKMEELIQKKNPTDPPTAKVSISGILKQFCWNWQKKLIFKDKKKTLSERS